MIPYNPSSFDTNKTILEQILELKNWLKAHPSYEIFYSSENGQSVADTGYLLSAIADPTNLAVGDVVIFSNAMVGAVLSVDADNGTYGCDACVSFKGPQGVQGPAGADGQNGTDGTCIRYCNYNKNLNPNTTYAITDITFSTGLQVNDCILFKNNLIGFVDNISGGTFRVTGNIRIDGKDGAYISNAQIDSNGDLIITIYDPETMISSSDNVGHVVGPAGSGIQIVALTSTSGTLSADDLSKVTGTDDCILIFTDNGADLTMQRILKDSSSVYFYAHFVDTGKASFLLCEVNAVTGAYTISGGDLPIKASNIDSDTATNGQVLTADGNGGASWQNAGGTNVVANPTLYGTEGALNGITIGSTSYYIKGYYETEITGSSGTFSPAVYGKLGFVNTAIKYNNISMRYIETLAGSYYYVAIDGSGNYHQVVVNTSRAYSYTTGTIGGSGKYMHYIRMQSVNNYWVLFSIVSTRSTAYDYSSIVSELQQFSGNFITANGVFLSGGVSHNVFGINYTSGGTIGLLYYDSGLNTQTYNTGTVTDNVVTL